MSTTLMEKEVPEKYKVEEARGKKPVRGFLAPWSFPENPASFMRRFSDEMDRLFGDFGMTRWFERELPMLPKATETFWTPKIDIFEREGNFIVRADLPGLTKNDVKVEITNEMITLNGERHDEKEETFEGYYRSERNYGKFYRYIPLPEGGAVDKAVASFKNGVLEVKVPLMKQEEPKARRLEIS